MTKTRITNTLGKIIPFFKKEEKMEQAPKTFVVIFNLANHISLLAATIYSAMLRAVDPEYQVALIDIRDRIPRTADRYLWVESGSPANLEPLFKEHAATAANPAEDRMWYRILREKSKVFESHHSETGEIAASVFGKIIHQFIGETSPEEFSENYEVRLGTVLLTHYWGLSKEFAKSTISVEDYIHYYRGLKLAYDAYHETPVSLEDLNSALKTVDGEEEGFSEKQKYMANLIARKTSETMVGRKHAFSISTLGPDVYGILRRIKLARKAFIHISMGAHGPVVYTESVLDSTVEVSKDTLTLAPTVEPKQQVG